MPPAGAAKRTAAALPARLPCWVSVPVVVPASGRSAVLVDSGWILTV